MTSLQNNTSKLVGACAEYPGIFDNPLLDKFDVASFLETQEHLLPSTEIDDTEEAKKQEEEKTALRNKLVLAAKELHEEEQPRAILAAKTVCQSCPLLERCEDWVLSSHSDQSDVYGVVAGLTVEERTSKRRKIKRQQRLNQRSVTIPSRLAEGEGKNMLATANLLSQ